MHTITGLGHTLPPVTAPACPCGTRSRPRARLRSALSQRCPHLHMPVLPRARPPRAELQTCPQSASPARGEERTLLTTRPRQSMTACSQMHANKCMHEPRPCGLRTSRSTTICKRGSYVDHLKIISMVEHLCPDVPRAARRLQARDCRTCSTAVPRAVAPSPRPRAARSAPARTSTEASREPAGHGGKWTTTSDIRPCNLSKHTTRAKP